MNKLSLLFILSFIILIGCGGGGGNTSAGTDSWTDSGTDSGTGVVIEPITPLTNYYETDFPHVDGTLGK